MTGRVEAASKIGPGASHPERAAGIPDTDAAEPRALQHVECGHGESERIVIRDASHSIHEDKAAAFDTSVQASLREEPGTAVKGAKTADAHRRHYGQGDERRFPRGSKP